MRRTLACLLVALAAACGSDVELVDTVPCDGPDDVVMHTIAVPAGGACSTACATGLHQIQDLRAIGYTFGPCPDSEP